MTQPQTEGRGSPRLETPSFEELHASIYPADVRINDRILARLRKRDAQEAEFVDVRIWRLSPLGVEIVDPETELELHKGDSVDLELVIGGQRTGFEGLVVDLVQETPLLRLVGIRLSRRTEIPQVSGERRRSTRWLCSDEFLPSCVAPAPGRFDEYIYLQIRDISADGLQLTCSLRNKFLVPGMPLHVTIVFPMGSTVTTTIEIRWIDLTSISGSEKLRLGAAIRDLSASARRAIGQYLIQFSDAENVETLRAVGFEPESVARGITFSCLKSEDDYRDVLQLRYLANKGPGHYRNAEGPEDTGDMLDAKSRIVIGKRRGRVIATLRFRYPQLDEPLQCEPFIRWPSDMPRRDELCEMTSLATHPEFRRGDLLAGLFRFGATTLLDVNRPWLVGYCMDKYRSFYQRLGFTILDLSYEDPTWNGRINVMLTRTFDMIKGKGMHPLYWNEIWSGVPELLEHQGIMKIDGTDRARMMLYKSLQPVTALLTQFARMRRR